MRQLIFTCTIAAALAACNSGSKDKSKSGSGITPAKPAGDIKVTISNMDKDTATVQFNFNIDTIQYEKVFPDVPLVKGFPDTAIYRVLWDEPNSVWIGFIKADRDTRYYHGQQDGPILKINWVPSPPARIYEYMERELGLGDAIRQQPLVDKYKKNIKSGDIIDDFIVELRPEKDKTNVYAEFGGVVRTLELPMVKDGKPYIQVYEEDNCFVGVQVSGELVEVFQIKVVKGRLGTKQLKTEIKL